MAHLPRHTLLPLLALLAPTSGCGSSDPEVTPRRLCELSAAVSCRAEAECGAEGGGDPEPPTLGGGSACVDSRTAELGCATMTEGALVYDSVAASECAAELSTGPLCGDDGLSARCSELCRQPGPGDGDGGGGGGGGGDGESCTLSTEAFCAPGRCGAVLQNTQTGFETLECVPAGDRPLGGECVVPSYAGDSDDCAAGLKCTAGTCLAMCETENDCAVDEDCAFEHSGSAAAVCFAACDVLLQNCLASEGCYPTGSGTVGYCYAEGYGFAGDSCEFMSDCQAGLVCVGSEASGTCRRMCDSAYDGLAAPTCDSFEICSATQTAGLGICN
jgi:hypothetical protein